MLQSLVVDFSHSLDLRETSLVFKNCWFFSMLMTRKAKETNDVHSIYNHEGARHCRKPLGRRKGLNISTTVRFILDLSNSRLL